MNRKDYGLLIEGWRKFLTEAKNPEAYKNIGVEFKKLAIDDDFDDFDDYDGYDGYDDDVEQKYWGEIGYLPIGGIGSIKKGMYAMDLRNEGRGDSDYDIEDNPFYRISSCLFDHLDIYYGGASPHDIVFKENVNEDWDNEGITQKPYLGAVLSKDSGKRDEQLDVIFDVLHKQFPKLIKAPFKATLADQLKDKDEVMEYKNKFYNNKGAAREMFAKMVTALRAKGLLLEQLLGGKNKS